MHQKHDKVQKMGIVPTFCAPQEAVNKEFHIFSACAEGSAASYADRLRTGIRSPGSGRTWCVSFPPQCARYSPAGTRPPESLCHAGPRPCRARAGPELCCKAAVPIHHEHGLDQDVLQFPDVSRVVVFHELAQHIPRQLRQALSHLRMVLFNQRLGQIGDIASWPGRGGIFRVTTLRR